MAKFDRTKVKQTVKKPQKETNDEREEPIDPIDNEERVDLTDTVDLSDTQQMEVIIQKQVVKKRSKWLLPTAVVSAIALVTAIAIYVNTPPMETTNADVIVNTTNANDQSAKPFTAELKRVADQTGVPYTISTEVIGGGYVLGITTYNPSDPKNMYMDYAIMKPEHTGEQATDEKATKIKESLSKDLPTINKSIVIKDQDKDKITMETYPMEGDIYQTILLCDGKPFAYVSTDKDGISTNYVTSYYVSDIAAE